MKRKRRTSRPQKTGGQNGSNAGSQKGAVSTIDSVQSLFRLGLVALISISGFYTCDAATVPGGQGVVLVMLWLFLLLAWAAAVWQGKLAPPRIDTIGWLMLGWLIVLTMSLLARKGTADFRASLNVYWQILSFACAFFLCRCIVRTATEQRAIVLTIIAIAGALSVSALYETYYERPHFEFIYFSSDEAGKQEFNKAIIGTEAPVGSPERFLVRTRIQSMEPMTSFVLTNSLAGYLIPCFLLMLGVVIMSFVKLDTKKKSLMPRSVALLLLVLIAWAILVTKSRTAYVAILSGCTLTVAVAAFQFSKRLAQVLGTILLVTVPVFAALVYFSGRLDHQILRESFKSLTFRFQYWRGAFNMALDYPFFGCGMGNFQSFYTHYKSAEASEVVADPHNFVLEVWATAGTLAMILALVVLVSALVKSFWTEPPGNLKHGIPFGSWVATVAGAIILSYVLGMISGYPVKMGPIYCGLVVVPLILWLGRDWIEDGHLPVSFLAIAVTALLVNLSAAGGFLIPGIATVLWVLVAFLLPPLSPSQSMSTAQRQGAALAAVVIIVLFAWTSYMPVMVSGQLLQAAQIQRGDPDAAMEKAVAWDPWNPRLRAVRVRQLYLRQQRKEEGNPQPMFDAMEAAVQVHPRAQSSFRLFSQWCFELYCLKNDEKYLIQATKFARRTVELYPNSSEGQARLAALLYLQRDPEHKGVAKTALELDIQNPHIEWKLSHRTMLQMLLPINVGLDILPPLVNEVNEAADAWLKRTIDDPKIGL